MNTLASWEGIDVRVSDIVAALDRLRKEDARTATRTSVVNLVVTAHSIAETDRALQIVDHMGQRNPARSLVLVVEPESDEPQSKLDALVRLHGSSAEGHPIWSDTVVLTVRGPVVNHLDSLVEPMTLPDLPVVVWYIATAPGPEDGLLDVADVVIVDTKELGALFALAAVNDVTERRPVIDLSWVRLRPWRMLLAGLFESEVTRPFVANITDAEVTGKQAPRLLLSGWLNSRLGLRQDRIHGIDDRHVRIRLLAEHNGTVGEFIVERPDGERFVRAAVTIKGGLCDEEILALPDQSLPWSLAEALTHLEANDVYEQALQSALQFD